MTPELDLAPIEQRLASATPGPLTKEDYGSNVGRLRVGSTFVLDVYTSGDRAFYFEALADLAATVAEVKRLRADREETRRQHREELRQLERDHREDMRTAAAEARLEALDSRRDGGW